MGKLKDFFVGPAPEPEPLPEPPVEEIAPEPEPEPEPVLAPAPLDLAPPAPDPIPSDQILFKRDPGGIFPSDAHRRVLCYVWWDEHVSAENLLSDLAKDEHTPLGAHTPTTVNGILDDLVQANYIIHDQNGFKRTDEGHAKLTGPIAEDIL